MTGRKPFGYCAKEAGIVDIIRLKRRKRKGAAGPTPFTQIAKELNSEGILPRDGKFWYPQTVKNVVRYWQSRESAKKVRGYKKRELSPHDHLERAEVSDCLVAIKATENSDLAMLFMFMVGSGVRSCEVVRVKVGDLSLRGRRSQVRVLGKGRGKGKWRTITLSTGLRKRLRAYIRGKSGFLFTGRQGDGLNYKNIYYRVKKIGKIAGFNWLHPHALRHTFGCILYDYKKDILLVHDQLGHESLETTKIYAKTSEKGKIDQMDCFNELI